MSSGLLDRYPAHATLARKRLSPPDARAPETKSTTPSPPPPTLEGRLLFNIMSLYKLPQAQASKKCGVTARSDTHSEAYFINKRILNTSAVSSILIFASCVVHRPLVFTHVWSFEYIQLLWTLPGRTPTKELSIIMVGSTMLLLWCYSTSMLLY